MQQEENRSFSKKNIAVVILTLNEEKHIGRCLENMQQVSDNIYIIDAYSTDRTLEIAKEYNAKIYQNKWVNHAHQFQWAMDNCQIDAPWIMRMDADEYLEPALIAEIKDRLPELSADVAGVYLKRKVLFKGKWIRYGGFYPHILMRLWRNGKGHIEQRWMDEHIVVSGGSTVYFKENMVDYNLNSIHWWVNKHNNYAVKEMVELLNIKYHFFEADEKLLNNENVVKQARRKRFIKEKVYSALSPGLRASFYFFFRYIVRLGFLDGYQGFVFHFMQGYWYRLLVDVNLQEFERKLEGNTSKENLIAILKRDYNIVLN
jgi:glycosyltransferase involved in cell wall biosynthesis